MNNYPIWWDSTITVYNKYEDPTTHKISWYSTVLTNCFWKDTGNKLTLGETTIDTNTTICRVPKNDNFVDRFTWDSLSDEDKRTKFTFSVGDIIVNGESTDVVNEYISGQRSTDLITKYKNMYGCIVIQKCGINTGVGRGNEHYHIRGV